MAQLLIRHDRAGARLAAPVDDRIFEGRVARIHKPGDALKYPWGEEHRDAAELAEVVRQLPGTKVTLSHPSGLLSDGVPARVIGKVISARVDGDYAVATMEIADPAAVQVIKDGIQQLSLGYTCNKDSAGYQRQTRVDHLAVVPAARCGASCSLRADCADGACGCSSCSVANADDNADAKLNAKERHAIPHKYFAIPSREGMPLEDAGHVRDAMARFTEEHWANAAEKRAAYHRIIARAHDLGIDASGFEKKEGAHLDQGGNVQGGCQCKSHAVNTDGMANTDSKEVSVDELKQQLQTAQAALAAEQAKTTDATKRADALEIERDEAKRDAAASAKALETAQAEAAAAEKARADATAATAAAAATAQAEVAAKVHTDAEQAEFEARVTARVEILGNAKAVLPVNDAEGKPADYSKQTDRALKVAIVKHVDADELGDERSADYVEAAYQGALKRAAVARNSMRGVRQTIAQHQRADQAPAPTGKTIELAAREAMNNDLSGARAQKSAPNTK